MANKDVFLNLIKIYEEATFLLKANVLPVVRYNAELDPIDIPFVWRPQTQKSKEQKQKETQEKQRTNREMINFPCNFCHNKTTGIRNFFYRGRKPILVLHYSGATTTKEKPFVKRNPSQVFKDEITGRVWNDLIQNIFNFSSEELYYQEYPACNFNSNVGTEIDWKKRSETCRVFVEETVRDFDIEGIILLGSSARLIFGQEKAKEMVGKISEWRFIDKALPVLTLRSPEALVFLEEKIKLKPEENGLFHYAEEKANLESSFLDHLRKLAVLIKMK